MGFYSIYRVFKDMIKTLFGKGFLKILILFVFLFLAYVIFASEGVFAETNITVNDSIFTETDINNARSLLGETLWNREDIDILFVYNAGQAYNNGDISRGKLVVYWNSSLVEDSIDSYRLSNMYNVGSYFNNYYYGYNVRFFNNGVNISPNITSYVRNLYTQDIYQYQNENYVALTQGTPANTIFLKAYRLHKDILDVNGNMLIPANASSNVDPFIVNNSQDIENWSFDKLSINLGTYDPYYTYIDFRTLKTFDLIYTYKDINYTINVDNYFHQVSGEYFIDIPVNALTNSVNIRNDSDISFTLSAGGRFIENDYFQLGTYSLVLTSEEQEQINQDSEKYVQSQILEEQQKTNENLNNINNNINNTNEKLDNLDNTINNSNVDNITNDTLPSDNTQDITADGVNGIFTSIYNAFCTGNAQDIVFPIPFTGKNITLSANYTSSMLTTANAGFVITLIQAFWWYLISRFIVKDIMNKINKIKSGNIEDIETTNIRGDML